MANYWAKLWIDVLDDPKMGLLDDHLWRRFFELLLIAKEENDNGFLPSPWHIAWRLHIDQADVEDVLQRLADVHTPDAPDAPGLVQLVSDRWQVTSFAKRQKRVDDDERQRRSRERRRLEELHGTGDAVTGSVTDESQDSHATVTGRDIEQSRAEKRPETELEQIVSVITATPPPQQIDKQEGGAPTPPPPMNTITAEQIQHYLEHPDPVLTEAWRAFTVDYTAANRTQFANWISKLRPIRLDDNGGILLGAADGYVEEWCRERLIIPIRRTLSGALGHQVNVSFCVLPSLQSGGTR